MKTIEERAKEYSKDHWNELTAKEAYIAGAKEQKKIDRVHFKKWYCKKICYKRKECQSPSIMCYRLGQIVKEIENI